MTWPVGDGRNRGRSAAGFRAGRPGWHGGREGWTGRCRRAGGRGGTTLENVQQAMMVGGRGDLLVQLPGQRGLQILADLDAASGQHPVWVCPGRTRWMVSTSSSGVISRARTRSATGLLCREWGPHSPARSPTRQLSNGRISRPGHPGQQLRDRALQPCWRISAPRTLSVSTAVFSRIRGRATKPVTAPRGSQHDPAPHWGFASGDTHAQG